MVVPWRPPALALGRMSPAGAAWHRHLHRWPRPALRPRLQAPRYVNHPHVWTLHANIDHCPKPKKSRLETGTCRTTRANLNTATTATQWKARKAMWWKARKPRKPPSRHLHCQLTVRKSSFADHAIRVVCDVTGRSPAPAFIRAICSSSCSLICGAGSIILPRRRVPPLASLSSAAFASAAGTSCASCTFCRFTSRLTCSRNAKAQASATVFKLLPLHVALDMQQECEGSGLSNCVKAERHCVTVVTRSRSNNVTVVWCSGVRHSCCRCDSCCGCETAVTDAATWPRAQHSPETTIQASFGLMPQDHHNKSRCPST